MWQLPRKITMFFLLVAAVGVLTACGARVATAQTQPQTQTLKHSTAAAAPAASQNGYVGNDTCVTCQSNLGYRISSVNGTRLFTDTGDVNGSLVSAYQTPPLSVLHGRFTRA